MKRLQIITALLLLCGPPAAHSLEKRYAAEGEHVEAHDYIGLFLEIPQSVQRTIGMTTARAERSDVQGKVHLNGRIPQDVDNVTDVYAQARGTVTACAVTLGQRVVTGDTLCTVETDQGPLKLNAAADGVVIAQFSKPGDRVDTVSPVMRLADYSRIPVNFDVYEKDVAKIRMEQKVLVYSSAYPQHVFKGKITFISPRIDETTYTLKIRAEVSNPDYLLKPGMFVRGEALLEATERHVAVPTYSVQNLDGLDVVFVQDEPDSFIPTEVRVAYRDGGRSVISGEIYDGDAVVVSGAYNLKSKIQEAEITGGCAHGH